MDPCRNTYSISALPIYPMNNFFLMPKLIKKVLIRLHLLIPPALLHAAHVAKCCGTVHIFFFYEVIIPILITWLYYTYFHHSFCEVIISILMCGCIIRDFLSL